jgi:hypothetical protein
LRRLIRPEAHCAVRPGGLINVSKPTRVYGVPTGDLEDDRW